MTTCSPPIQWLIKMCQGIIKYNLIIMMMMMIKMIMMIMMIMIMMMMIMVGVSDYDIIQVVIVYF